MTKEEKNKTDWNLFTSPWFYISIIFGLLFWWGVYVLIF